MIYSYSGQLVIPLGAVPPADGGANMGTSAQRWATYYGVTGAINTSDAREKTEVRQLDQAELNAAMALSKEIGGYKWLQSIAEKGEEGARTHIGMTVQRAIEIMAAQGLDPLEYAFICHDEWEAIEEQSQEIIRGNIYSVGELLYENAAHSVFEQYKDFPAFTWEETSRETIITQQGREAGDRYGFRYDQLALFIARGQEERIARLESLIGSNP
ncbi:tail fiber domain-containing protein [Pseudomonas sp. NPDC087804]|uniref:tail fiber domain-containing protein n=1 Tax=Pseudomonas sp. NPDC087804 TaxID=3364449 RepID=UPI0038245B2C